MRLTNYINEYGSKKDVSLEGLEPVEVAKIIARDSKKYIKLLKGKKPLYRGSELMHSIGIKGVRKDRNPLGTPKDLFKKTNKWLSDKGWAKRDESIMTTSDRGQIGMFGNRAFYIFPKGDFKYAWVKSKDFNDTKWSSKTGWDIDKLDDLVSYTGGMEDDETQKYLNDNIFGNKGFDTAYNNGYEIWFDAKDYFYIDSNLFFNSAANPRIMELKNELKKVGINV